MQRATPMLRDAAYLIEAALKFRFNPDNVSPKLAGDLAPSGLNQAVRGGLLKISLGPPR